MTAIDMEGCPGTKVWQNRDGTFDVDVGDGQSFSNIQVDWDEEDKWMEIVLDGKRMELTVVFEEEKDGDTAVSLWNR